MLMVFFQKFQKKVKKNEMILGGYVGTEGNP